MGLLLLRIVIGVQLVAVAFAQGRSFLGGAGGSALGGALGLLWAGASGFIVVGLLTPFIHVVVTLSFVPAIWWSTQLGVVPGALGGWWPAALALTITLSLALLGPGAYSVDAYLFGRREINIPPRIRSSASSD